MLITRMQPVQEAYFGKSKNLLEAEKIIQDIITRFDVPFEKVGKRIIDAAKLNSSSENKKLEELFKREFGFGEMVIHWEGTDTANAYTMTRGVMRLIDEDIPKLPVQSKSGGYYDPSHNYLCVVNIYAGLIDMGLTAEEMVSVILHEIGHNFQCTPINNIAIICDYLWIPINAIYTYKSLQGSWEAFNQLRNIIKTGKLVKAGQIKHTIEIHRQLVQGFSQEAVNLAYYLISFFVHFKRLGFRTIGLIYSEFAPELLKESFKEMDEWILNNKNKVEAKWKAYVKRYRKRQEEIAKNKDYVSWKILGSSVFDLAWIVFLRDMTIIQDLYDSQTHYSGEVFADSFATAYGYGPAMVSSQTKFEKYRLENPAFGLQKSNKYNTYNQYIYLMYEMTTGMLDPHPRSQTRIKNQINKLERELDSDDIPPKMKEIIRNDLEKSRELYNAFLELPEEERHLVAIANFNHMNEMYFGGKIEFRDFINRVINFGMAEA